MRRIFWQIFGFITKNWIAFNEKRIEPPLAKGVLIPLGLTATVSVTGAAIHKKMFGYGTRILIISNKEIS